MGSVGFLESEDNTVDCLLMAVGCHGMDHSCLCPSDGVFGRCDLAALRMSGHPVATVDRDVLIYSSHWTMRLDLAGR
jgi:hypothetical protein